MIEVKGIYKRYKDDYLFENFSMALPDGEVSVLIGPSGLGKTTLLRMIAGLEPYERGSITGVEQRRLSFVFQEDRFLPWLTAGDNIGLVLKAGMTESEAKAKTRQVLDLLHLSEAYGMMPSELSGGMQRRLAIGRALAYDAEILLLDEPFKGMDEALKAEILPKLAESWQTTGKTVILVTHDLAEAHKISRNIFELSGKPIAWSRCPSD